MKLINVTLGHLVSNCYAFSQFCRDARPPVKGITVVNYFRKLTTSLHNIELNIAEK